MAQDINIGQLAETLNDKADIDLNNTGVFADGVKGNRLTIGLTNGTKNIGLSGTLGKNPNAFAGTIESNYGTDVGTALSVAWSNAGAANSLGLTTDPTKSGMVVDKTVPSGWNLYYYIGDTLQNAQLINVARIEETVINKTNKVQAAEASMPSSKSIRLKVGATGTTYTAPANGWFYVCCISTATGGYVNTYTDAGAGGLGFMYTFSGTETGYSYKMTVPAKSGDICHLSYNNVSMDSTIADYYGLWFHYAQGDQ